MKIEIPEKIRRAIIYLFWICLFVGIFLILEAAT